MISMSDMGRSLPCPLVELRLVDTVLVCVALTLDLHVAKFFLRVCAGCLKLRYPINHVHRDAEAVDLILNRQVKRRVDVALFLVSADVKVSVIHAPIREAMNKPGISMEV